MSNAEGLALYQFNSCPFCARVRNAIDSLGLEIELRHTDRSPGHGDELMAAMGQGTVPVLRIEEADGSVRWLPESRDIIDYLQRRFGG